MLSLLSDISSGHRFVAEIQDDVVKIHSLNYFRSYSVVSWGFTFSKLLFSQSELFSSEGICIDVLWAMYVIDGDVLILNLWWLSKEIREVALPVA